MTTTYTALIITFLLCMYLFIREGIVTDYRRQWYTLLTGSPESLELFTRRVPGYLRMVLHWKPLKDKYWIPKELIALRSVAALSPDDRKKLIDFINRNPERYPPGPATEAWKDTIRKMDQDPGE